MKITIRKAFIGDVHGIAKVHVDSWNTTYTGIVPNECLEARTYKGQEDRWLKRYFKNDCTKEFLYVAVTDNEDVVGFACGSSENEDIEYKGIISTIYILKSYQRQGIGKQLVKVMVEEMLRSGVNKLIIWAFEENPSCNFYEKIGGKELIARKVNICGKDLIEKGYCWTNLNQLLSELN